MLRRIASLAMFCACALSVCAAAEPGAKVQAKPEGKAAAKPKRKAVPIGGEWNLSGAELEKAKMDGKRVLQLVAKGDAKLKRGRNPLMGPWVLEASAEIIECDFPGKRFIVRGPFTIQKKRPDGGATEIVGLSEKTTAELSFKDAAVKVEGPNKVRAINPAPAEENPPAPVADEK